MLDAARLHAKAHSRIGGVVAPHLFVGERIAIQRSLVGSQESRIEEFVPMVLVPGHADILVERKRIVEPVAQLITALFVDLGNGVGIGRFTNKEADWDLAVWVGKHRSLSGKGESHMASVVLIPSKDG